MGKRDPETGALDLAYDNKGSTINAGRQVADYKGGISSLDSLLQRIFSVMDIRDPQSRIFMNYYADGQCRTGVHRHDFWTCLVSFGAERILTVDNRPLLLRDGDLIVFGTQNHGVPPMPDVTAGRVSLVIFFYPDHDNLERRQWQTITDDNDQEGGEEVVATANSTAMRGGVDTTFRVAMLWGDGGQTSVGCVQAASDSGATDALQHSLAPSEKHRALFQSPNSLQWNGNPDHECQDDSVTIFPVGVGNLSEKDFFQLLASAGIAQLWDLRALESTRGCPCFAEPAALRQCCAVRHISLRTVHLGRREAGGIKAHLESEEGQHTLKKVADVARSAGPIAFLCAGEDYRKDAHRMAIANAFTCDFKTQVRHLDSGNALHASPGLEHTFVPQPRPIARKAQVPTAQVATPNANQGRCEKETPPVLSIEKDEVGAMPVLQSLTAAAPNHDESERVPTKRVNRWGRASRAQPTSDT